VRNKDGCLTSLAAVITIWEPLVWTIQPPGFELTYFLLRAATAMARKREREVYFILINTACLEG